VSSAPSVLVVDGANVVGARPDGWWKDRAGAARRLHEQLVTADLDGDIVLVLEGAAKSGVPVGRDGHVTVVHAPQDGDAEIVRQAHKAAEAGRQVTVVTADRLLAARVAKAGTTVGPTWLLDRLT
jgi:predicted RNA-binding protein with PIN domain